MLTIRAGVWCTAREVMSFFFLLFTFNVDTHGTRYTFELRDEVRHVYNEKKI